MPGLLGCIGGKGRPAPEALADLGRMLRHEPGYVTWELETDNAALLGVYPPVADALSGSFHGRDSGIAVGYYGEFYGRPFDSLTTPEGVARRLAELYERHGTGLPAVLDGSFAVFVRDRDRDLTCIFNDHYGSRPVFYARQNGRLYFSPEPKAIAAAPGVRTTVDSAALVSLLVNGHLLRDQSLHREIRSLPGGSMILIEKGRFRIERHYRFAFGSSQENRSEQSYMEEFADLLLAAVRKRLRDIEHTVVPISGGLDSRGLLACVRRITDAPIQTVSWGTDEATRDADAWIGRRLAEHFGTSHTFLPRRADALPAEVEPMVYRLDGMNDDPAFHHHELPIMRRIRDELGCTHLFRGDPGDPMRYQAPTSDVEALAMIGIRGLDAYPSVQAILNPTLVQDLERESAHLVEEVIDECPADDFTDERDFFFYAQHVNGYTNPSTYYKLTVFEVQTPWLDKGLLDFIQRLPTRLRSDRYLYEKTLRVMFPELESIPVARRDSLEDWRFILRRDRELQRFIWRHLVEDRNEFHDFLNREALAGFLSKTWAGGDRSPGMAAMGGAKRAMSTVSPALYGRLKTIIAPRVRMREITSDKLIFRLLVAKLWFDVCKLSSASAAPGSGADRPRVRGD
jgi:asparagine synthetase B (glutamine-hydrolysing)